MSRVPFAARALGLAGLIPFIWGVLTTFSPPLTEIGVAWFGPRFVGPYLQVFYGVVILAFMSGVLWGFATRAGDGFAGAGCALSVLPALWAFFAAGGGPATAALWIGLGFVGILGLDWLFWRRGLAPGWWMDLRIALTAGVILCLAVTSLA